MLDQELSLRKKTRYPLRKKEQTVPESVGAAGRAGCPQLLPLPAGGAPLPALLWDRHPKQRVEGPESVAQRVWRLLPLPLCPLGGPSHTTERKGTSQFWGGADPRLASESRRRTDGITEA